MPLKLDYSCCMYSENLLEHGMFEDTCLVLLIELYQLFDEGEGGQVFKFVLIVYSSWAGIINVVQGFIQKNLDLPVHQPLGKYKWKYPIILYLYWYISFKEEGVCELKQETVLGVVFYK